MVTVMGAQCNRACSSPIIFQVLFSLGGQTTKLNGDMIGVITPEFFMS